jgi:hypothetical protein
VSATAQRTPAVERRHVVEVVAAVLGGAVLAVAMTWPVVLRLGREIAQDLADPLFQAWQVAWLGHALVHQPLHLFQSNIFWPLADSLAFSDVLAGYTPAGLVAQRDAHAALVVYNLLFLLAYALAFVGAYLLARELGAGRLGAAAAGAAFAYAPWRLAQNGHLQVLSSGGIALALALLVRGYRRRSAPLVLSGWLAAAWQMSLGFSLGLQFAYLLGALAVIVAVVKWRSIRSFATTARPVLEASAVGIGIFALVTFAQARPYLRVLDHHPEAERTPAQVASFSPRPVGLLAAPPESYIWGDAMAGLRERYDLLSEQTLFPGLAVLALALVGLFGSAYRARLRAGLALGVVVCAVLSVGLRDVSGPRRFVTPYRVLYELAPGWDGVRTPGRINTLTSLGLALLAAAGVCLVAGRVRGWARARRPRARSALPANVAALLVAAPLVAAILVEGLGPIPLEPVPAPPPALRQAAPPLLHLPIDFSYGGRYAYWSVGAFGPVVNGTGAFEPTQLIDLRERVERFPDTASIAALRSLGVRTVVLHPELAVGTPWEEAASRPVAGLPLTRTDEGTAVVYRLGAPPQ